MPATEISPTTGIHKASIRSSFSSNGSSSSYCSSTITCNSSSSSNPDCCSITPTSPSPSQLQDAAESNLSSPLKLDQHYIAESTLLSDPSPCRRSGNSKEDSCNHQTVKKNMGLMKLRSQGTHPPAGNSGSSFINQAAEARDLMASLERLSITKKASTAMKNDAESEREAQRSLLGENEEEIRASCRGTAIPLCAKIAAAMDAEGRIGVQKEIASYREQQQNVAEIIMMSPIPRGNAKIQKTTKKKQRGRWIMRRKLRSSRALLGNIWKTIKRVFSSSTKRHLKKDLLSISKH